MRCFANVTGVADKRVSSCSVVDIYVAEVYSDGSKFTVGIYADRYNGAVLRSVIDDSEQCGLFFTYYNRYGILRLDVSLPFIGCVVRLIHILYICGMNPNRLHTIEIEWSYPRKLSDFEQSPYADEKEGLYYITRRYLRSVLFEKSLYIGETKRTFRKRLREHLDSRKRSRWTYAYGEMYVRFGKIKKPTLLESGQDLKRFLRTVESSLIWEVEPEENKRQTQSATFNYRIRIVNTGYRGGIPKEIAPYRELPTRRD